ASYWWDPARPRLSWEQILTEHRSVIINTGVTDGGVLVSEKLTRLMGSMMLFTMRNAIARCCSNWAEQNRWVSVFADELSLLAEAGPEVITWLRNQGRSYGVRQVLATQYPDQLHPKVSDALLSFSNCFWFTQT